MTRARLLVLAVALSAGCSRARGDVERVCEVSPDEAPGTRAARLDRGLDRLAPSLKTDEGKRLVRRMRSANGDPGALLSAEAKRLGIERCPLADAYLEERERARYRFDVERLCAYRLDEVGVDGLLSNDGRALAKALAAMDEPSRRARLATAAKDVGLAGCAKAKP
jgi:hypothetical protein